MISATRDAEKWKVTIIDTPTNESITLILSDSHFGAIMALAIGVGETEHDFTQTTIAELYAIAEPCFENIKSKFRIIP